MFSVRESVDLRHWVTHIASESCCRNFGLIRSPSMKYRLSIRCVMKRSALSIPVVLLAAVSATGGLAQERHALPDGFVYLDEAIPDIVVELKYTSDDNFVGQPIDGFRHEHAILSEPATAALAEVQATLQSFGLGLKVFDAYRPQRAVDHFVRWGEDLGDQRTKPYFYPDVAKGGPVRGGLHRRAIRPFAG